MINNNNNNEVIRARTHARTHDNSIMSMVRKTVVGAGE